MAPATGGLTRSEMPIPRVPHADKLLREPHKNAGKVSRAVIPGLLPLSRTDFSGTTEAQGERIDATARRWKTPFLAVCSLYRSILGAKSTKV